jgi:glutamine synthetase
MANERVQFLQLYFMDLLGRTKSITLPMEAAPEALEKGWSFDGSSIVGYATIDESDLVAVPDLRTFLVEPWTTGENRSARFICDIHHPSGKRFKGDPRYVLERTLERASRLGYVFNTGPEFEFFLFKRDEEGYPTTDLTDHGTYFDNMPLERSGVIRKKAMNLCREIGFPVDSSHHEVAPSQHEIDLVYTEAMTVADRILTLKQVIKAVAAEHNLFASFMPKPVFGVCGNGMHVHMSLFDGEGSNAFYDPDAPNELSAMAMNFLGGLLEHARESCGILNSWVNSYKRLVPGFEAPCYIAWALHNRSALVRVPAGRGKATRFEVRNPDPAGNPYLQFAVLCASGMDGVERGLEPPKKVETDLFKLSDAKREDMGIESLPSNLGYAMSIIRESEFMRDLLGDHIVDHLFHVKMAEWREYQTQVTEWEIDNLLPIL